MIDKFIVIMPSIVLVLYALTAAAFCAKREWDWALVYFGYALALIGLIIASFPKGS